MKPTLLMACCMLLAATLGCVPETRKSVGARAASEGLSWLNDALIVGYTDNSSDEERETVARDFDLDFLDWYCGASMNRGNFFRARGVRNSGPEEYEYQEALQFSLADAEALFADNGIAITLEGKRAHFPPQQYHGAYFMCHNAPKWHETVKQGIIRLIPFGHSLTQDNIGCPLNKGNGNFCPWCARGFQKFMAGRYGRTAFLRFGVRSPSAFDPRVYILEKKKTAGPEALLEDPLVREYIRFQYISELRAWEDICEEARQEAETKDRPAPALYGNQYGAWGSLPFATALSSRVDVVWIECACFGLGWNKPQDAWGPLVSKVGLAAGGFSKPVWLWPMEYAESSKRGPYSDARVRVVLAESFANGGVVVQRMGKIGSPCYKTHKEFSAFLAENRALFAQRERLVDVGLVYSFPTWMWRRFSSLSVDFPALKSFPGLARVMEDAHLPYEVVIFGHPDVWDDARMPASLGKYRALALPGVDCVSERQAAALRDYVSAGGSLVVCGDFATRDEEFRPRKHPIFPGIKLDKNGPVAFGKGKIVVVPQSDMDAFLGKDTRTRGFAAIKTALLKALGGRSHVVATNAPEKAWLNVWSQEQGRRVSVHLVNYDADLEKDVITPATNIELEIEPQAGVALDTALLLSPDAPAEKLAIVPQGNAFKVVVPQLRSYAIVVFTKGDELNLANLRAHAARLKDRADVAGAIRFGESVAATPIEDVRWEGVSAEAIQRDVIPKLERQLRNYTEEYMATRRHSRASLVERAQHAVAAFDFGNEKAPPGWKAATKDLRYDKTKGYGWDDPTSIALRESKGSDDLLADALSSRLTRAFNADLPPGNYTVTVICSSPNDILRGTTQVEAEGAPRLLGALLHGGLVTCRSFPVTVNDGQLNIRFVGYDTRQFFPADGPVGPTTWLVNGLLIEKPDAAPAPVRADAVRHGNLAQASLRDWLVIGPFDDSACEGMTTAYPPEKRVDFWASYQGQGGTTCAWRRFHGPGDGGIALVPFNQVYDDLDGVVAYGFTTVKSEERCPAVLVFSSTGRGVVWLNGRVVLTDRSATGLVTNEYRVPVTIEKGWNRILVKVCNAWPGQWAFCASLLDAASRPLTDITVSPTGDSGKAGKLAVVSAFPPPAVESATDKIEMGGAVEVKVSFENKSSEPVSGALALRAASPVGDVVRVQPNSPITFTNLGPGQRASQTFSVRLARCPADATPIVLNAKVSSGEREKQASLRLAPVIPIMRLAPGRGFIYAPFEQVVNSEDSAEAWKPPSDNVRAISVDQAMKHDAKPTLKVELVNNGDGVESFGRIRMEFPDGSDWSAYNTLRYWVRCSDSNSIVTKRNICMVVSDRETGWHALASHPVPMNQWMLIEDDLTNCPREAVVNIAPHLYEQYLNQKGTYTWHIGELRLTKESREHPELDALAKTPLGPGEGLLRLTLTNPLSRELTGSVTLTLPEGWRLDMAPAVPVSLAHGKSFTHIFRVAFPKSEGGRQRTVRAVLFLGEWGTLEVPIELSCPQRLAASRVARPPVLDGRLDDPCWKNAEVAQNFMLNDGSGPAKAQSLAYVAHDDKNLYVAYRCDEPQMKFLVAKVKDRDGRVWEDDCIEIFLQPDRANPQDFYHIVFNTLGMLRDERGASADWDSHATAKVALAPDGWTLEAAIPFSSLGSPPKPGDTWGLNLCRTRQAKPGADREFSCWSCTHGPFGKPERFGELLFQK